MPRRSDTPAPAPRRPVTALLGAALTLAALALPAAASADHYLGSTLAAAPTVAEAFPQDTTFWSTALPAPSGATSTFDRTVVPEDGQILQFQLSGMAAGGFGPQPIHFQDLRPVAGGALRIVATSQAFTLPETSSVWSFDVTNFCVKAGDRLGFSDEGGAQESPSGVPFQVFGTEAGAQTQYFSRHNGVMNGAQINGSALPPGTELLMAAYEGTGGHASPLCGGVQGIEFRLPTGTATVDGAGTTQLSIGCQGTFPCNGHLSLQLPAAHAGATRARRPRKRPSLAIGSARFAIPRQHTSKVRVRLTARGRRLLRARGGRLKVTLAVSAGAGGAADTVTSPLTLHG